MVKICDFPYPLHDLKKEPLLKEHAQFKAKCLHVNNTDPIYDQNGLNWALSSGAADAYVVPPGFQSRHLLPVLLCLWTNILIKFYDWFISLEENNAMNCFRAACWVQTSWFVLGFFNERRQLRWIVTSKSITTKIPCWRFQQYKEFPIQLPLISGDEKKNVSYETMLFRASGSISNTPMNEGNFLLHKKQWWLRTIMNSFLITKNF